MVQLIGISKHFGSHRVFEDVSLEMYPREKVALIGPHGSGKSTLLRVLAGMEPYQRGQVLLPPWTWVGYLPQEVPATNQTVSDLFQAARDDYFRIRGEAPPAGCPPCFAGVGDRKPRHGLLACHGKCGIGLSCRLIALQLGLHHLLPDTWLMVLDPEERKRLWLASLLLSPPDLLLLDEPTQGLDVAQMEWLERYLKGFVGSLILVSQDRALLGNVTDAAWEIDPTRGSVRRVEGGFNRPRRPEDGPHFLTSERNRRRRWRVTAPDLN